MAKQSRVSAERLRGDESLCETERICQDLHAEGYSAIAERMKRISTLLTGSKRAPCSMALIRISLKAEMTWSV